MKFNELDCDIQDGINFYFDKFIEGTFDYCTNDYEAISDFLNKKAEFYKEEAEYEN